jgi:hypothetical protein
MRQLRENLVIAGLRKDNKSEAQINSEKKAGTALSRVLRGHNARKEARQLKEEARIDKIDADNREIRKEKEKAGKVITKAAQRYQANKEKKAWVQKAKADLEAEIAALQEEMKGGSRPQKETKSSVKSKVINKAFESITDYWLADTTKEAKTEAEKQLNKLQNKLKKILRINYQQELKHYKKEENY